MDSIGVDYTAKEIRKFIWNKNIITNIYRIQAYDPIMCEYFLIGFINCFLKGKSLLEYTNLFSPNEHKKNDKLILKYCQQNINKLKWWKSVVVFAINIENLKTIRYLIFLKNH